MVDAFGAPREMLNDRREIEDLLATACRKSGAHVLHRFSFRFVPQGVTAICVLAESHASIHTYPEKGVYMADVFTCGSIDPEAAIEYLVDVLGGDARVEYRLRGRA